LGGGGGAWGGRGGPQGGGIFVPQGLFGGLGKGNLRFTHRTQKGGGPPGPFSRVFVKPEDPQDFTGQKKKGVCVKSEKN